MAVSEVRKEAKYNIETKGEEDTKGRYKSHLRDRISLCLVHQRKDILMTGKSKNKDTEATQIFKFNERKGLDFMGSESQMTKINNCQHSDIHKSYQTKKTRVL